MRTSSSFKSDYFSNWISYPWIRTNYRTTKRILHKPIESQNRYQFVLFLICISVGASSRFILVGDCLGPLHRCLICSGKYQKFQNHKFLALLCRLCGWNMLIQTQTTIIALILPWIKHVDYETQMKTARKNIWITPT